MIIKFIFILFNKLISFNNKELIICFLRIKDIYKEVLITKILSIIPLKKLLKRIPFNNTFTLKNNKKRGVIKVYILMFIKDLLN